MRVGYSICLVVRCLCDNENINISRSGAGPGPLGFTVLDEPCSSRDRPRPALRGAYGGEAGRLAGGGGGGDGGPAPRFRTL